MEHEAAGVAENVVELRGHGEQAARQIAPHDWRRFEAYVDEIVTAFGMDVDTPGTGDTPERFLRALYDATSGYDGDPKLLTVFPAESCGGPDSLRSQIIEGPIAFYSLCEHHSLRAPLAAVPRVRPRCVRRRRADHRHLEADPAGSALRAPVHRAGAARRADRGHARRADLAARRRRPPRGVAPLHADARRRGALAHDHDVLARDVLRRGAAARVPARGSQPQSLVLS